MAQSAGQAAHEPLNENDVQAIDHLRDAYARLRKELGRVIVGQRDVIERLSICLFARGHALLMGVPGLANTDETLYEFVEDAHAAGLELG